MPAQVEAILDRCRAIRHLLRSEVTQAAPAELDVKTGDRWSAREVLIHIGNWEAEAVRWLPYFLRGEQPPPQEERPIDELNAAMLARYDNLDLPGVLAYIQGLRDEFERLARQITAEQLQNPQFLGVLLMCADHEIGHLHQLRQALAGARGQVVAAAIHQLRYHRQRVLTRLNLEYRSVDALHWRPEEGKWSIREQLLHLAAWDRVAAGVFAAIAEGREVPPMPFPEGGLDAWNQAQVAAGAWMSLADVIAELGAAREALEAQVWRLTPAQAAEEPAAGWLRFGEHDKEHMYSMLKRLAGWRQAQG